MLGNARKPPKQRAWRKLHIAVDRETGTIVASELTASRARDATRVPALLTQIQAPLVSVAADSAYDKEAVYEAIEAHSPGRRTRVVITPQRNATLSQNSNTAMQERGRHIRAIEKHGRREWYKLSGYTKRSMVENAVYRYKAIIGPEMRARTLARQRVEHRIGCEILNKMAALGMPDTYCARVTLQPAQGGPAICSGPRATTPIAVDRKTGTIVASELTASRARERNASPRFANTDSSTSSVGGGGQCIRQGNGLQSHRSAQPWTKDARGDSAATKRDAQSEFEHRHAGARSPYSCNRKTRPT